MPTEVNSKTKTTTTEDHNVGEQNDKKEKRAGTERRGNRISAGSCPSGLFCCNFLHTFHIPNVMQAKHPEETPFSKRVIVRRSRHRHDLESVTR